MDLHILKRLRVGVFGDLSDLRILQDLALLRGYVPFYYTHYGWNVKQILGEGSIKRSESLGWLRSGSELCSCIVGWSPEHRLKPMPLLLGLGGGGFGGVDELADFGALLF